MMNLRRDAPLGTALVQVAKSHRRLVGTALEALGLHVGQDLLLARLCGEEGIRQTALAEALGIEMPTVNKTLARLESAGFVERRPDPVDARASLAFLTARGRDVCDGIEEIWVAADRRLRESLPAEEAAQFERLLGSLAARLGMDVTGLDVNAASADAER